MSFVTTARGPDGLGGQSAGHWLCDERRRWGGGSPTTGEATHISASYFFSFFPLCLPVWPVNPSCAGLMRGRW